MGPVAVWCKLLGRFVVKSHDTIRLSPQSTPQAASQRGCGRAAGDEFQERHLSHRLHRRRQLSCWSPLSGETLITDMRYTTQLEEECPGLKLEIRGPGEQMLPVTASVIERATIKRLGIEAESATVSLERSLAKALPKRRNRRRPRAWSSGCGSSRTRTKSRRRASPAGRRERAFDVVRALLDAGDDRAGRGGRARIPGPALRREGAELSGDRRRRAAGGAAARDADDGDDSSESDFVLIDWGANSGLYMSDLTRIIVTGKISPKLRKVYGVVLTAQLAAIDAIRPGVTCEQVDRVARKIISKAGFGKAFGHGLGHGTGLEIHEAPRLAVGPKDQAAAGHDRDGRAGNLLARLGRRENRGRHAGHAHRPRGALRRAEATGRLRLGVVTAAALKRRFPFATRQTRSLNIERIKGDRHGLQLGIRPRRRVRRAQGPPVHRADERARSVGDRSAAGRSADSPAPRPGDRDRRRRGRRRWHRCRLRQPASSGAAKRRGRRQPRQRRCQLHSRSAARWSARFTPPPTPTRRHS